MPCPTDVETLMTEHDGLVQQLAKMLRLRVPPCFDLEDLIQEGRLGLLDAISKFDAELGVPFAAYARRRILGAMLDSMRRNHWIDATMQSIFADEPGDDRVYRHEPSHTPDYESEIDAKRRAAEIRGAVVQLPPREKLVIEEHYYSERTLLEVGADMAVNNSRACQIHFRSLVRLKEKPSVQRHGLRLVA